MCGLLKKKKERKNKKKIDSSLFIPDRKGLKKPSTHSRSKGTVLCSADKPSPGNSRERGVFYLLVQR